MFLHDIGYRRKSQASAFARGLGRESRFKDFVQQFGRDTRSRIRHRQQDKRTGWRTFPAAHGYVFQDDIVCLDQECASLGHGIAGVDAQVQQHLMKLGCIAQNWLEIVGDTALHSDRAREGVLNQLGHVPDEMPKLNHHRLAGRTNGEREDLFDHVATPVGARTDRLQHTPSHLAGQFVLQQLRRHEDRSEYIIQIVGNASSQGPNAFHPLSAEEFLFQTLLLGDVQECAQNRWPARVFGQYVVDFHMDQAAVFASHPKFIGRTEHLAPQAFL